MSCYVMLLLPPPLLLLPLLPPPTCLDEVVLPLSGLYRSHEPLGIAQPVGHRQPQRQLLPGIRDEGAVERPFVIGPFPHWLAGSGTGLGRQPAGCSAWMQGRRGSRHRGHGGPLPPLTATVAAGQGCLQRARRRPPLTATSPVAAA